MSDKDKIKDGTPVEAVDETSVEAVDETSVETTDGNADASKANRNNFLSIFTGRGKNPQTPTIIIPQSKEIQIITESLEESFNKAIETQKVFQLLKAGETMPDFKQVLKIFSSEMLEASHNFQDPTFILCAKGYSFNDLLSAVNSNVKNYVQDYQKNISAGTFYNEHADIKSEHWGAYIVDGASEMSIIKEFDDPELAIRKRLQLFNEYKKLNNLTGMDRWKYIQLMMQKMKDKKLIDKKFRTILDSDPFSSQSVVLRAGWSRDDFSHFFQTPLAIPFSGNLFRRLVGDKIRDL